MHHYRVRFINGIVEVTSNGGVSRPLHIRGSHQLVHQIYLADATLAPPYATRRLLLQAQNPSTGLQSQLVCAPKLSV